MKIYRTKQKSAILEYIENNKNKYFTIDQIVLELKKNNISVGRTTVYRYIKNLVEQGKINVFASNKNTETYFQLVDMENSPHIHFKCEVCDEILKIDCCEYSKLVDHIEQSHSLNVSTIQTVIYGRCSKCLEN